MSELLNATNPNPFLQSIRLSSRIAANILLLLAITIPVHSQNVSRTGDALTNQNSEETLEVGTLRGYVEIDSKPLPNGCMEIRNLRTPTLLVHSCTNEVGAFEVHNLPEGKYEIVVRSGIDELREQIQINSLSLANLTLSLKTRNKAIPSQQYSIAASQMTIPEKARKAVGKAWNALRKFRLADARKNAELALQISPTYSDALMLTGILDLQDNQLQTSTTKLEQAIKYDAGNGMAYIMLAANYNAAARFDDALLALSSGMRLRPDMWQGHFESARAELGKGDFHSALRHLNRAEELVKHEFPLIHLEKARALVSVQEFARGATELETFLREEPSGLNAEAARRMLVDVRLRAKQGQQ